jgi:predicted nuclease of restriction endonuclease-like (RecB) superfamily
MGSSNITFEKLVDSIRQIDLQLAEQAGRAVNISLTLRNWLIGYHISEFELHGKDRATYGERLLVALSHTLRKHRISNTGKRQLYNYRSFYKTYPQIVRTLSAQSRMLLPAPETGMNIVRTPSALSGISAEKLVSNLAYSHLELLLECEDPLKRAFYEVECIRGNWSVRELKRQIATLYYERSGLSTDKKKLASLVRLKSEKQEPRLTVRDPYVFEFLGIKAKEVMGESDVEDAIIDKLQEFLLELGHGFCFEARQKRILIGSRHCFIDLVFYHRVLKCHVLIELKIDEFKHEYLGQLNTYVSWYKKNVMAKGDNPPIGILLCTHKDHSLVEYALADMKNSLFVSKYQIELPKKEEMVRFIEEQMREVKK